MAALPIANTVLTAAGSLGSGITDVATAYSGKDAVRANRRRLAELERREQLDALGLTQEELQLMDQRMRQPAMQAIQGAQRLAERQAASSATGDVQALAGQQAALEALGATETQIGGQLAEANIMEARRQRQELEDRRAADAQVRANRARAVGQLLTGGVIGGAQKGVQEQAKLGTARQDASYAARLSPRQIAVLEALHEEEDAEKRNSLQGY